MRKIGDDSALLSARELGVAGQALIKTVRLDKY